MSRGEEAYIEPVRSSVEERGGPSTARIEVKEKTEENAA